ncbi:hypothetical protein L3X38_031676 [Prunus dulcis]|uniref:Uncharacterized protein n=1 Tax=Prunus dulcis TaxID=3755 RepID=A0AAD4VCK1_PRUDU|nr:hypothetical protein L3X38_031676 [Prunus dulcis]
MALLLSVFQDRLGKICITEKQASHWLPCKKRGPLSKGDCSKGKVPLLTATDWQHLQLFIFVLATVHATFSILTILFARFGEGNQHTPVFLSGFVVETIQLF